MARVKKQVLGDVIGTVGEVSFSKRKGKNQVKGKPDRPKRKAGERLPDQNLKLPLIVKLMSKFDSQINLGFANKAKRDWTPVNAAVAYNMKRSIIGNAPDFDIDYSKISISRGKRETAWSGRYTYAEGRVTVTWEIPQCVKLKTVGTDKAYLLFYNSTKKRTVMVNGHVDRAALSFQAPGRHFVTGGTMHAWIFFVSPDGKETSNSDYLGSIIIDKIM